MTEAEIQFLKKSIDRPVEIRTVDGELLIAKILFVSKSEEFDEHDVLYDVISSNKIGSYKNLGVSGGYVLDFKDIVSVDPVPNLRNDN